MNCIGWGLSMKDYEYAIAPTSQFFFCGVPFRLDVTPKCSLNCAYCFAASRGGRRTECDQIINTIDFINKYNDVQSGSKRQNIVKEMLSSRYALHIGGMSDPFASKESAQAFDEIVERLYLDEYPIIVSTKRPSQLMDREHFLSMNNTIIQVSLAITDAAIQKKLEPLSDDISCRLKTIEELIKKGKNVSCRIQPIIPQLVDTIPNLIDSLVDVGCQHIILEFLKLPVEKQSLAYDAFNKVLETDMFDFYMRNNAILDGREWLLPTQFRYETLKKLKEYANQRGVSVSIADYGLYHLGDTDNCCGIDKFNLKCTWNKGNFSVLIRQKKGLLYFQDLYDNRYPSRSMTKYINSHCRLERNTMLEHLRSRWNKPGTANAPDCYYGVRFTGEYDCNNDCIYFNESQEVLI